MADSYPGTPRWVKILGLGALALAFLVVIVLIAGGGDHGPGRHFGVQNAALKNMGADPHR